MKMTRYQTITYDEEIPNTLDKFSNWEFSSGGTTGEDFKIFARLFKKEIKKRLPDGAELVNFHVGHYDLSGFIYLDGQYIYLSISDVRHFPRRWHDNILIRTAKSNQDYTGGSNNYVALPDLGRKVLYLLQ